MRTSLITLLAVLGVLAPTASASAAVVPPGNSGATQYSETLPGAGGEETSHQGPTADNPAANKTGSGKKGGGKDSPVSSQVASELHELGSEGEAALNLAGAGAPANSAPTEPGSKSHQMKHQKKKKKKNHGRKHHGKKHHGKNEAGATNPSNPGGPNAGNGGSSGLGEVLGGAVGTSSGGLGFLQPLILATVLIGAGAYVLRRRGAPADRT